MIQSQQKTIQQLQVDILSTPKHYKAPQTSPRKRQEFQQHNSLQRRGEASVTFEQFSKETENYVAHISTEIDNNFHERLSIRSEMVDLHFQNLFLSHEFECKLSQRETSPSALSHLISEMHRNLCRKNKLVGKLSKVSQKLDLQSLCNSVPSHINNKVFSHLVQQKVSLNKLELEKTIFRKDANSKELFLRKTGSDRLIESPFFASSLHNGLSYYVGDRWPSDELCNSVPQTVKASFAVTDESSLRYFENKLREFKRTTAEPPSVNKFKRKEGPVSSVNLKGLEETMLVSPKRRRTEEEVILDKVLERTTPKDPKLKTKIPKPTVPPPFKSKVHSLEAIYSKGKENEISNFNPRQSVYERLFSTKPK